MWLMVPWFAWRRQPAEAVYATAANLLFTLAMADELRIYVDKRRSGEVKQISSLDEFVHAHPAVRG